MRKVAVAFIIFAVGCIWSFRLEFKLELVSDLAQMAKADQLVAKVPEGEMRDWPEEYYQTYKDSILHSNCARLKEIFVRYGYPGYDKVGEQGEKDFWMMVQHCDFDIEFQQAVLEKQKEEVLKNNANGINYAYLCDRVLLNTGKKQLYGTQVKYKADVCQAIPHPLQDSVNVNIRRGELGMSPLEEYLNEMSALMFEINKTAFLHAGIQGPTLYKIKK